MALTFTYASPAATDVKTLSVYVRTPADTTDDYDYTTSTWTAVQTAFIKIGDFAGDGLPTFTSAANETLDTNESGEIPLTQTFTFTGNMFCTSKANYDGMKAAEGSQCDIILMNADDFTTPTALDEYEVIKNVKLNFDLNGASKSVRQLNLNISKNVAQKSDVYEIAVITAP